jgi:hypothetical protein
VDTPPLGSTTTRRDVDWLREQLASLAVGCPHTRSNPSSCPLHEVRLLEPAAILDWLDGLSSDEKEFLMLYHQCCLVINRERDAVAEQWSDRTRSDLPARKRPRGSKSAAAPLRNRGAR